jgi:hypothetical protein
MEWKRGERETCRYLARDPKEADEKLRFYAETKDGWHVITLEAVRPHGGRFVNDAGDVIPSPFSDSPPKEITPCRLLPLPCYATEEEAKQHDPNNWTESLWIKPEQEHTVQELLTRLREAARVARSKSEFPFERDYCAKIEALTLDEFKQGQWQGQANYARDSFLVADWVVRNKVETVQMHRDAETCFNWMSGQKWHRPATPAWRGYEVEILEEELEPVFQRVADRFLTERYGSSYRAMFRYRRSVFAPLLARVWYKVTFRNDAVLFLTSREERDLRASELAEVGGLRPGDDESAEEQEKTIRRILEEMKPEELDREIIRLHENDISQDKIVAELRRQGRGKGKKYVGRIIGEWENRKAAAGLHKRIRVTGPGLPIGKDFRLNRTEIHTATLDDATSSRGLEDEEKQGILARWGDYTEEERSQFLAEYRELRPDVIRWHWDRWDTFPPEKQNSLMESFPELKKAFGQGLKPRARTDPKPIA